MTWVEAMQDYRVNFNTVVDKFNKAHRGVPYEKGHGIKQFRRWEHMMGQRVDENGVRPHPGRCTKPSKVKTTKAQTSTENGLQWVHTTRLLTVVLAVSTMWLPPEAQRHYLCRCSCRRFVGELRRWTELADLYGRINQHWGE